MTYATPFSNVEPDKPRVFAVRYEHGDKLVDIAEKSHCKVSDVIREALDSYIGMRDQVRVRKKYVVVRLTRRQLLALADVLPVMEQYGAEWHKHVSKPVQRRAMEAYDIILQAQRAIYADDGR